MISYRPDNDTSLMRVMKISIIVSSLQQIMRKPIELVTLAMMLTSIAETRPSSPHEGGIGISRIRACKITAPTYETKERECRDGEGCNQTLTLTGVFDGDIDIIFCASANMTAFLVSYKCKDTFCASTNITYLVVS